MHERLLLLLLGFSGHHTVTKQYIRPHGLIPCGARIAQWRQIAPNAGFR